jgi:preprotein translocase subunit Sec63
MSQITDYILVILLRQHFVHSELHKLDSCCNMDTSDIDYYELLEIPITSTEKVISKAYRLKALKCHPDKNPDDKAAGIQILTLCGILPNPKLS